MLVLKPSLHVRFLEIWHPGLEDLFVNVNFNVEVPKLAVEFRMLLLHLSILDGLFHVVRQHLEILVAGGVQPVLLLRLVITVARQVFLRDILLLFLARPLVRKALSVLVGELIIHLTGFLLELRSRSLTFLESLYLILQQICFLINLIFRTLSFLKQDCFLLDAFFVDGPLESLRERNELFNVYVTFLVEAEIVLECILGGLPSVDCSESFPHLFRQSLCQLVLQSLSLSLFSQLLSFHLLFVLLVLGRLSDII